LLAIHAVAFLMRYVFVSGTALVVYLPFVVFPLHTLHGPLVELFVRRSLFNEPLRGPRRLIFWLGPPICLVGFALLFAAIPEFRDRDAILAQVPSVALFSGVSILSFAVYDLVFWLGAVKAVGAYRRRFEENFSNLDSLRLQFIQAFLGFMGLVYLAHGGLALLSFLFRWRFPVTPLESLLLLGMTYLVLYYLIRRPQIFTLPADALEAQPSGETAASPQETSGPLAPDPSAPKAEASGSPPDGAASAAPALDQPGKYARQSLGADTRRVYLGRIQTYMDTERPFLDGELTLAGLADALTIPKHHLSMVINIELEQNFFQFVNGYRVGEARRLLTDADLAGENLLDIAYRAGFRSKAAFNRVFKEAVGQTPGQFRKAAAGDGS